jgi:hypothetical protein
MKFTSHNLENINLEAFQKHKSKVLHPTVKNMVNFWSFIIIQDQEKSGKFMIIFQMS